MSRVLIVEDEKVLQDVYKLILSSKGFEVETANNGFECLQQLKASAPDVVLLDLFMPVMDGKEVLQNIDVKDYPDTKFIIYTNLYDKETEAVMLQLGAHKVVLKANMAPNELVDLVTKMVRLRRRKK